MGLMFSSSKPRNSANVPVHLTPAEKEHLVFLGSTAGTPSIIVDAIKSGNIFDPMHVERAKAMNEEWNRGIAVLAPFTKKQEHIETEEEHMLRLGQKIEGTTQSYKAAEEQTGACISKRTSGLSKSIRNNTRTTLHTS